MTNMPLRQRIDTLIEETTSGTQRLRLSAKAPVDLWIEVDGDNKTASMKIENIPQNVNIPEIKSSDAIQVSGFESGASTTVVIVLTNFKFVEIFGRLVEDLTKTAEEEPTAELSLSSTLRRLTSWNRLFAASARGLGSSAQKGLIGELSLLLEVVNSLGPAIAVQTWKGPLGSPQDFERGPVGVEVKATSGAAPNVVRVSSERQLDPTAASPLLLWAVLLQPAPAGETLNEWVDRARAAFEVDAAALSDFEYLLSRAGYLETHRDRYSEKFIVVEKRCYRVLEGFPRIDHEWLPEGVGSVRYALSLAACEPWRVDTAAMLAAFCPEEN